ncbi:GIY-YIG nuclease family protein [Patescibacteria group bacterium]|nr:GIY-YIG nuclease family protein [Patescibacteria group bacterium]MBU2508915.1 GIY-YIG nuclease family protein [Patescibacteria group bacterium]
MSNKFNTVLYTGVTNDLIRRVYEHKEKLNPDAFTSKYGINKLVFYEIAEDAIVAIEREKQIKAGSRKKKFALVQEMNPEWNDLYEDIIQ